MSPAPRTVRVAPERLARWVEGFEANHPGTAWTVADGAPTLRADDGAEAIMISPWGSAAGADLLADVARPRTVGALLVRKGGYAVGVFRGRELLVSKVGSAYVQSRTKAGGWSQQRFARRRANQATKAYAEAAEVAARLLAARHDLEAVATGGDQTGLAEVLADPRLSGLADLVMPRTHPVVDPRLRVLEAFPDQFLAVEIRLNAMA